MNRRSPRRDGMERYRPDESYYSQMPIREPEYRPLRDPPLRDEMYELRRESNLRHSTVPSRLKKSSRFDEPPRSESPVSGLMPKIVAPSNLHPAIPSNPIIPEQGPPKRFIPPLLPIAILPGWKAVPIHPQPTPIPEIVAEFRNPFRNPIPPPLVSIKTIPTEERKELSFQPENDRMATLQAQHQVSDSHVRELRNSGQQQQHFYDQRIPGAFENHRQPESEKTLVPDPFESHRKRESRTTSKSFEFSL